MSIRTEKRLVDFIKWWKYNTTGYDDVGVALTKLKLPEDPMKRDELVADAIESFYNTLVDMAEDLQVVEGRGAVGRNVSKIITPDNILKRNH
jgi:hypothetical protein